MKKNAISAFPGLLVLVFLAGCAMEPRAKVDRGLEEKLPPYTGPRASVAVARFDWKVDTPGSTTVIKEVPRGVGHGVKWKRRKIIISQEHTGFITGLRDMLTTSLVQTKRFRVLERQEFGTIEEEIALAEEGYVEEETAVKKGRVKGADLLIVASVTGWEPGASGVRGGGGALGGGLLGGLFGSYDKSYLAMDIRIIDASTSEILAAARVEGEAEDVDLTVLAGGITGGVALGGFLRTFEKTPMEKAIRISIEEAVKYVATNTPGGYFKY
jgi:curli biogenesis system outer membrane secretion channel CsgG